jgi:serine/threonine protein kinase
MEPTLAEVPEIDPIEDRMAACFDSPPEEQVQRVELLCAEFPAWSAEIRRRYRALCAMGFGALDRIEPQLPEQLGDFRPIERLGSGGMGVVYRAEQVSLGRQVALKLVRPELLFFPGARERFRREVDAIARLDHPGIVPVFAVGEEHGLPYFAMALVEGCTLADLLSEVSGRDPASLTGADFATALESRGIHPERGPGSIFEGSWTAGCLALVRETAEALAHAHSRGVVHRDVKPSNLAITARGRAMLLDFGLTSSAGAERLTLTGAQPGTPHYMAPEQVRGEPVDARADVYSLGVTLFELLTLRLPFEGPQLHAVRLGILAGNAPPIRSFNRRVPRAAQLVCRVAMELDPERRYAGADLFANDLHCVAEGRPIQARPPGALLRCARWARRHPTASVGTVLGLALLGGLPTTVYLKERAHTLELRDSLGREMQARGALEVTNAELEHSLDRERDLREKEETARADAETTLTFFGNLFRDLAPEKLQGRPFDLRAWLELSDAGRTALADRPGVLPFLVVCLTFHKSVIRLQYCHSCTSDILFVPVGGLAISQSQSEGHCCFHGI